MASTMYEPPGRLVAWSGLCRPAVRSRVNWGVEGDGWCGEGGVRAATVRVRLPVCGALLSGGSFGAHRCSVALRGLVPTLSRVCVVLRV